MATQNGRSSTTGIKRGSVLNRVIDLDYVLINELGQFGRFQLNNLLLVSIPLIMTAFMTEYNFSAAAIPHRCMIPECGETAQNALYDRESLLDAFPEDESCERFMPLGINGTLDYCPSSLFHQTETIECDGYVYERTNSVVYDFDLGCQNWLRTLAGTLNSTGTMMMHLIIGFVSDRWGRRIALILSVFNVGFFGLVRAFSINYPMYLALQFLQTLLGAGSFSSAYIFAAELVGPKYRVLTSAICSSMFALGQVVLAAVAWLIQPWRYMTMAIHIPCFLIICYYWFLSESVRWLLSKGKYNKARDVLEKVARVNKKQISDKSLIALMTPPPTPVTSNVGPGPGLFMTIVKSPVMLRRVCTTPVLWMTTTFVYYGLSIKSVTLPATNMYVNYMLSGAVEIPGFFAAVLVLDRIGRKATLSCGFFLSAICNIAFAFIPAEMSTLGLIVFLIGKFGIAIVFTSVYLYTSELYPTQYRHTLLASSSMIGRVGGVIAPLTPALADIWPGIPSLMFAAMGVLSGVLVLTLPETLGTKMPDTMAEAEALGKPESKLNIPPTHL